MRRPVFRSVIVFLGLVLLGSAEVAAWNRAGHMVTGAIAYRELERRDPEALEAVVRLLEKHPYYTSRWRAEVHKSFVPEGERNLYLFMLAARWADDAREDEKYHRGPWHYINYPLRAAGYAAASVEGPAESNLVTALSENVGILEGEGGAKERAVALAWLFHLVGDAHQPLHASRFFGPRFPEGDRGGTRFYIRVGEGSQTIGLHALWDDLVIGSRRFRDVRNRATELVARVDRQRLEQSGYALDGSAVEESLRLAWELAYREGRLEGSAGPEHGALLPADYLDAAKPVAEERLVLAGYRLADRLAELF
jgi:hypothetical protein